eukprot:scaffold810_cov355-Pavlova_lutheri.AAC.17
MTSLCNWCCKQARDKSPGRVRGIFEVQVKDHVGSMAILRPVVAWIKFALDDSQTRQAPIRQPGAALMKV